MNPEEIKKLIKEEIEKVAETGSLKAIHQSQITPKMIKQRHLEDAVIKFGLAADKPTDDSTGVRCYFATDTNTLYCWNGAAWVGEVLS